MTTTNRSTTMNIVEIAKVCHEANRAYCAVIGDDSQLPWDDAPGWQQESAIEGVAFVQSNPNAPSSASHESWLEHKQANGWTYGPEKDADAKTHPCCVPFDELPVEEQRKDALFRNVVLALGFLSGSHDEEQT